MRVAVPVAAALFTSPSWYQCVVDHGASLQSTAIRFAIALPIAWVLLMLVQKAAQVPAHVETSQKDFAEFEQGGIPEFPIPPSTTFEPNAD
jgi:hypothetical protein